MSAVTDAIDAEITEIEADLKQNPDPRVKRLEHLRSVRTFYLDANVLVASATDAPAPSAPRSFPPLERSALEVRAVAPFRFAPRPIGRKPSPERVKALSATQAYLLGKAEPIRTAKILSHLTNIGVPVPGSEPLNNLSAMLSGDPRFRSHGRAGWTLVNVEAKAQ